MGRRAFFPAILLILSTLQGCSSSDSAVALSPQSEANAAPDSGAALPPAGEADTTPDIAVQPTDGEADTTPDSGEVLPPDSEPGYVSSDTRPATSRPATSQNVDVFNDFIATERKSPDQSSGDSSNLFPGNSGFENGTAGWLSCVSGGIQQVSDAYEGNGALQINKNGCLYRSIEATPGQSYLLSCFVKLSSQQGWTGMGINFSSNFRTLHESPMAVATSGEYARISTIGTAPEGTDSANVWMYSDQGAVVDHCTLALSAQLPPTESPVDNSNLLSNGDFSKVNESGSTLDWTVGCGGIVLPKNSGLYLDDGACVDQALNISAINKIATHKTSTFSCLITEIDGRHADLSIYLDNELLGFMTISPGDKNKRVGLTVDNVQASSGFVSLFSESNLQVEQCELSVDGVKKEPVSQLLENGDFEGAIVGGFPDRWSLGCGSPPNIITNAEAMKAVELTNYSCLRYVFNADELAQLSGSTFKVSCSIGEHSFPNLEINLNGQTDSFNQVDMSELTTGEIQAPTTLTSGYVSISAVQKSIFSSCELVLLK